MDFLAAPAVVNPDKAVWEEWGRWAVSGKTPDKAVWGNSVAHETLLAAFPVW